MEGEYFHRIEFAIYMSRTDKKKTGRNIRYIDKLKLFCYNNTVQFTLGGDIDDHKRLDNTFHSSCMQWHSHIYYADVYEILF